MGQYNDYGMGGTNPCGAYYPCGNQGVFPMPADSKCITEGSDFCSNVPDNGSGLCCDTFKRVNENSGYSWDIDDSYVMFDTLAGTGPECAGCSFHSYRTGPFNAYNPNNTSASWQDEQPCEVRLGGNHVTSYVERWSACWLETNPGCTMHNSFGLIMNNTVNTTHAGSPNGSCQSNCMQLNIGFWESRVAGEFITYAQYPPNNFDDTIVYDGEQPQTDWNGNKGPTGPKLIWAGFSPTQMPPTTGSIKDSVPQVNFLYPNSAHPMTSSPIPGISTTVNLFWDTTLGNSPQNESYPFIDTVGGETYRGYLPNLGIVDPDNAWGLLDSSLGGTDPQPESRLWARKSIWRIKGPNTTASATAVDDAFSTCSYASFGCTDPAFGNYNSQAFLDCDGIPKTNRFLPIDGSCTAADNSAGICWGPTGLNCTDCIDPATNTYYTTAPDPGGGSITVGGNATTPNPAIPITPGSCTAQMLTSCGASGNLSNAAWTSMNASRPQSWLYGGGADAIGQLPNGSGFARFWDKDGNDVTGSGTPPLCQCNNSGCMLPGALNFSNLNTTDCSNNPLPTSPAGLPYYDQFGDVGCCTFTQYGCTDNTSDNYFCSIDLNDDGLPDNAQYCMDPTGVPCYDTQFGTLNPNCDGGPNGNVGGAGVPLSSSAGNLPTVNLVDDGTCNLILESGCRDDGGNLAGGTWASPLYPGYSAINFDAAATVHTQSSCEYVFGCPDPLSDNYLTNPVCINPTLGINTGTIAEVTGIYGVTSTFVETNLIPNIECCDYNLAGTGPGCTDPNALNYNPLAITDDGSCMYNIEGCTDPNALNYNPSATLDDSSCIYETDYPGDGDNFLDGTPVEICREPLTKEEVLMNVCQPTEIQSEVFIERGKQSVFEPNQRLDEVKTIGGLKIYGYGFYNIKEQI